MVSFETMLPRLVAAYECGRLVPFIGSGMSIPTCVDWKTLVWRLEKAAAIKPASAEKLSSDLIRRANVAIRTLKSRERGALVTAVREATFKDGTQVPEIPPQTQALARLWWPLVLTTNYDNLYERSFAESFPVSPEEGMFAPQYGLVGRSAEDCQRVLNSLATAGRALIWALQGYLDGDPALHEQLVIGHEQYRRATHREPHFRRAFAEVFRQRSFLFLGSGISETYLQELFGEVLELFGPSTRPHYAVLPADEVAQLDPDFMLARFQITVASYPDGQHQWVPKYLDRLREEIEGAGSKPVAWSWGRGAPELEVIRGPLPTKQPAEGHCLAVSAGGGDRFFFSPGIEQVLSGWKVRVGEQQPEELESAPHLGRYPGLPVYAVRARSETDQKALPYVYEAASQLFREAGPRYRRIHMQLLAAGAVDKLNQRHPDRRYDVRPFPPRFSFVQMVRAYADCRREHPDVMCRLVVHIVDPAVSRELASGRIDVTELLNCVDIRFWTEVILDSGEVERRLFQEMPEVRLDAIVRQIDLAPEHWTVTVTPPPRLEEPEKQPVTLLLGRDLRELGVVPGSTLHFRRP